MTSYNPIKYKQFNEVSQVKMISPEVVKVSNCLVDLAENPIIDAASPTTISIFGGLVLMTMKDIQFNYLFPKEFVHGCSH